jgi:hypothetical protein
MQTDSAFILNEGRVAAQSIFQMNIHVDNFDPEIHSINELKCTAVEVEKWCNVNNKIVRF